MVLITFGIILACCGLTAAATAWWVKRNLYASTMTPVQLTAQEQRTFETKMEVLQHPPVSEPASPAVSPEDEKRTVVVTDREINAYLAKQGLGDTVKVDLGDDNLAATVIVPVPEDSPLFGGTTLRLRVALGVKVDGINAPSFQVSDVSLGGLPLPNAWLGDIKNVNLAGQNLEKDPALQRFFAGIKKFQVRKEGVLLTLNE